MKLNTLRDIEHILNVIFDVGNSDKMVKELYSEMKFGESNLFELKDLIKSVVSTDPELRFTSVVIDKMNSVGEIAKPWNP